MLGSTSGVFINEIMEAMECQQDGCIPDSGDEVPREKTGPPNHGDDQRK
jgi:hypothetical protein